MDLLASKKAARELNEGATSSQGREDLRTNSARNIHRRLNSYSDVCTSGLI